jgi:hypothetical protein
MQKIDKIVNVVKLEGLINNTKRIIYFISYTLDPSTRPEYFVNGEKFITEQINKVNSPNKLHIFTGDDAISMNQKNLSININYNTSMAKMIFENTTNKNIIYHTEKYPLSYREFVLASNILLDNNENQDDELSNTIKKICTDNYILKNYSYYIREIKIYLEKIVELENRYRISFFLTDARPIIYYNDEESAIKTILVHKIFSIFRYLNFIRKINKDEKIQNIIIFGRGKDKILEELIKTHNFKITFSTVNPTEIQNTTYLFYNIFNISNSFVELENNFSLNF